MTTPSEPWSTEDPIGSYASTWRRVMGDPRGFFDTLSPASPLPPALVFALVSFAIGGVGFMLFGGGVKGFLGLIALGALRVIVGSAIATWIAQQVFEGRGDYEATFRVLAYSSAVVVFVGLPVVKYFAAIYGAYLLILGLAKAHAFDTVRSLLTVMLSVAVGLVALYALNLGGCMVEANPLLR